MCERGLKDGVRPRDVSWIRELGFESLPRSTRCEPAERAPSLNGGSRVSYRLPPS